MQLFRGKIHMRQRASILRKARTNNGVKT